MIFFGRYHCLAKNPKCQACPLQVIVSTMKEQQRNKVENVTFFGLHTCKFVQTSNLTKSRTENRRNDLEAGAI